MSTDTKKHTSIAAGEKPSRAGLAAALLSINDIVPVANVTEANQIGAALIALGVSLSTTPLTVRRADAAGLHTIEVTKDGTNWAPASSVLHFSTTGARDTWTTTNSALLTGGDTCWVATTEYLWSGTAWVTAGASVKVRRAAAQSCANASFTAISFDTQVHSTQSSMWSAGSGTRLVAPVAGVYLLSATVGFATVTTGRIGWFARVNGTTAQYGGALHKADNDAGIAASTDIQLAAGDYVEILAYQESGGPANTGTANYSMPTASMHLVATI